MSVIALPETWRRHMRLSGPLLYVPSQVNRSRWTGRRKVVGLPGAETWRGTVQIGPLVTEAEERVWRKFLLGLRGQQNVFHWPLPRNPHIGAKPVVASGAVPGYTLPLQGMQPNARIVRAGQYMTIPLPSGHYRTVCLMDDLVSNASGQATATFEPAITELPALAAVVETVNPFIPMSVASDEPLGFVHDDAIGIVSFEVEEAL